MGDLGFAPFHLTINHIVFIEHQLGAWLDLMPFWRYVLEVRLGRGSLSAVPEESVKGVDLNKSLFHNA